MHIHLAISGNAAHAKSLHDANRLPFPKQYSLFSCQKHSFLFNNSQKVSSSLKSSTGGVGATGTGTVASRRVAQSEVGSTQSAVEVRGPRA